MRCQALIEHVEALAQRDAAPVDFIEAAGAALVSSKVGIDDVATFIRRQWDPFGPGLDWTDTEKVPFVVDLHCTPRWGLRASIWADTPQDRWLDEPHNHIRFIATTALTEVAYIECVYESLAAACVREGGKQRPLRRGDLRLIRPETIHEIRLADSAGMSLSVRTHAVAREVVVFDRMSQSTRSKAPPGASRKAALLGFLESMSRGPTDR